MESGTPSGHSRPTFSDTDQSREKVNGSDENGIYPTATIVLGCHNEITNDAAKPESFFSAG